jgi:hypothetical protein
MADMPFSQALSKQVFSLFNEGVPLNGICTITGIPLQELWKFKFSLDQGRTAMADPARPAISAGRRCDRRTGGGRPAETFPT